MSIKKALLAIILAVGVVAGMATGANAQEQHIRGAGSPQAIKNNYIVVLKEDVATASAGTMLQSAGGGHVKQTYKKALNGFAAQMTEQAAKKLAQNPSVKFVEQDAVATASGVQSNPPSWGLDRIDQRNLPLNLSYTYPNTASNVTAYIIDSGIRISHQDFGGRASYGYDFIDNDAIADDCRGHGTHVAGTVGGTAHGVAKGVKLVAVRALGCDGTGAYSQIIAAVDWVTINAMRPAITNMSLGGGVSSALNNAVQNSIASGIVYAVSAGNDGGNACDKSPASTPNAITVGNTNTTDARYSSSNYGTCLDLFAPGVNILSSYNTGDTATTRMTGTSMASPHVAGAAALLLAANPTWTPQQVRDSLVANATNGVVTSAGTGSPNKLLFVVNTATPPPASCGPFTNSTNYNIPDLGQVKSPISVANCNRNASSASKVAVDIKHTYRGDLKIYLVAPDATRYLLKNSNPSDGGDNVRATYTVNLSAKSANGEWKLRVDDVEPRDVGYIDSWTFTP